MFGQICILQAAAVATAVSKISSKKTKELWMKSNVT
jgi:hypothetical protein